MNLHDILLPVFVQVALVVALAILMGRRRYEAVKAGAVRREDVILGQRNWPAKAQTAANAFSNQFELPMLYFALVPLAIITRKADVIFVVLSWIFVLSRIGHALAYVTTNELRYRAPIFIAGAVALTILWIQFAIRILGQPLPA